MDFAIDVHLESSIDYRDILQSEDDNGGEDTFISTIEAARETSR